MSPDHVTPEGTTQPRAPVCRTHFRCDLCPATTDVPLSTGWVVDGPVTLCPIHDRRSDP